jgi:glycine cleavage system aminomethyltransferase T
MGRCRLNFDQPLVGSGVFGLALITKAFCSMAFKLFEHLKRFFRFVSRDIQRYLSTLDGVLLELLRCQALIYAVFEKYEPVVAVRRIRMTDLSKGLRFVVNALPSEGARPNELARTMAPHPLIYQELPYSPEYTIYNRRLASVGMSNLTADEVYWKVRRQVILRHTGELPLEICGPDAEKLLNLVFTRNISKNKVGRCSYQFACYHDGGMITDGVLVRLAEDRFWYGQGDGDLFSWLKAHAHDMNVEVFNPDVWASQVQGPDAMKVLEASLDGAYPEKFNYFDAVEVQIAGQKVVIGRSGFTNELGWEFYLEPGIDARAVGDRILEAGKPFGMVPTSAEAFRTRRIEAGMLNAGSDFDETVHPFAAGLGHMVDFDKGDFIGRDALLAVDQRNRTWGMRVEGGVAHIGRVLSKDGETAGVVCSSAWSPFLQCGVTIVRLDNPELGPGVKFEVECTDGQIHSAEVCVTPMYDHAREIPRGLLVDIPEIPVSLVKPAQAAVAGEETPSMV